MFFHIIRLMYILGHWYPSNHFKVNPCKCKATIFSRRRIPITPHNPIVLYTGRSVEFVDSVKHHGVRISSHLSQPKYISDISSKATATLWGSFFPVLLQSCADTDTIRKLRPTVVQPHLEHCSEV